MRNIEKETMGFGQRLFSSMKGESPGLFNKNYWQGMLLEWVMKDPSFKLDLFRFVDVLASLQRTEQVTAHLREYLLKEGRKLPAVLSAALKVASHGVTASLSTKAIRSNIVDMAGRFIVGKNAAEAVKQLEELHRKGIGFTVDLLGEATLSDFEGENYLALYRTLLNTLVEESQHWVDDKTVDSNHLGPIPRVNISVKLSALDCHLRATDPRGSVDRLFDKVLPFFILAKERGVHVNVDLEQWETHGIIYDCFERIVLHEALRDWPHLGIVVQAYLCSAQKDVERLLAISKKRRTPLSVRLVKGAYWDYEVVNARRNGYLLPVWDSKEQTDLSFENISQFLLTNIKYLWPAFGSHNLRSLSHAIVCAQQMGIPPSAIEIQMLYGMAEPEREAIRKQGYRVRLYAPIGELLPGVAYLVRRLLENTSNSGFLRMSHFDKRDLAELLKAPIPKISETIQALKQEFVNCPLTDFTNEDSRTNFSDAIKAWEKQTPKDVPVVINGEERKSGQVDERVSPNQKSKRVANVFWGTPKDVVDAVTIAKASFPTWRDRPLKERAALLVDLASRLSTDRVRLAALQCLEVGKQWKEADADVVEAIDFCNYYAQQALSELSPKILGNMAGESNGLHYLGRGVCVVIAPWNFPLAIVCGMTVAALVTGNTVVIKPAEQSSLTAYELYKHLVSAGFPKEVVQFVPGNGEELGPMLVEHPDVVQIAFTGSKAVGLQIIEKASIVRAGQKELKRVICEMGGKNAIIVDEDADLDEAISGVMQSAFGYAGQKCSACSRVLVVGSIFETFVKRLVEAVQSATIGSSEDPGCDIGPVVDPDAHRRLMERIRAAEAEGVRVLFKGHAPDFGYFVPPTLFEVKDPQHWLMHEELFGPVLSLIQVASIDEALTIAMNTELCLTGAIYTRTPSHVELAKSRFRVGNLYINRGSTGAMVYRQPFGGAGMSGFGTKAGGPGYLLHFVNPYSVCENTMRRGFAPETV